MDALRLAEDKGLGSRGNRAQRGSTRGRIMDYGKFKYEEAKRAHDAKLKQKIIQVKEVKFRPGTDDGDYNAQAAQPEAFPRKMVTRPRSRCVSAAVRWPTRKSGARMLERLKADLEELGQVEQMPKMEGRQMVMVLAPKKKK